VTALARAVVEAVRAARTRDPAGALLLVVPSRVLGRALRRDAALALGGVANVHVLTLPDLADRVAGLPLARAGRRPLPPLGDGLLVARGIREAVPAAGGYFSEVAGLPNFSGALLGTLLDLKRAGIPPARLAAAAPAGPAGAKLREVAGVYAAVETARLGGGFVDASDLLAEAARLLEEAPGRLEAAGVVVAGFLETNPLEERLLEACARAAPLERCPATAGPPLPAGAIEIVAAPGEEREVREVARVVIEHVEAGGRFEEVGVLLPDSRAYRAPVRDVFGAAGIPYVLAPGGGGARTLGETRAGRGLALLVEAGRSDFARAAMLDFFTFADLRDGPGVVPAEWDRLSRDAGIVRGARDWRARLERLGARLAGPAAGRDAGEEGPEGGDGVRDRRALAALHRAATRLIRGFRRIPAEGPPAALAGALASTYRRLVAPGPEAEAVLGALAGLEDLAALEATLTRDALWPLVEAALARPAPADAEPGEGQVYVGDLAASVGLAFPLTVVVGAVEGRLPAPVRPDPILLDAERRAFPGLPLADRARALDRLRFQVVAGAGPRRLVVTYPRVDAGSGRPRVPSVLLLDLLEALTGRRHDFAALEAFPGHRRVPLHPAPAAAARTPVDEREWLLTRALAARAAPAALLARLPAAARGLVAVRAREGDPALTAFDGRLPAGVDPGGEPVAPTALETYAACPFRYFLAHVLRVRAPQEPGEVRLLDAREQGSLVHAVLEDAYRRLGGAGALPLRPDGLDAAEAALAEAFDQACEAAERRGVTGLPALWAGTRARLRAQLRAALEAEAGAGEPWRPALLEVPFGLAWVEGADPPVDYPLPDGTALAFRGRVDRIDLSPDGARARVIDYKTGRARGALAADRLQGGRALQLPVYRLAAAAALAGRGIRAEVEDAHYYHVVGRDAGRRIAFTRAGWAARQADFDRVLALVVEGLRAGRFHQRPADCGGRGPCAFDQACGAERARWAEAKAGDPAARRHAELDAIP
jgi:RecB family exonuclease